ncbi:MAG: hypothetical protein R6U50_09690 [Desulfobacterales bacterium]
MSKEIPPEKFYETIVQNTQRGDPYAIKFCGDPNRYVGIPIFDRTEESDDIFTLKVLEGGKTGMYKRCLQDIESMESV